MSLGKCPKDPTNIIEENPHPLHESQSDCNLVIISKYLGVNSVLWLGVFARVLSFSFIFTTKLCILHLETKNENPPIPHFEAV